MVKLVLLICLVCLVALGLACSTSGTPDYSKPDFTITASLPPQDVEYVETHKDNIWAFPASIQIGAAGQDQVTQHYVKGARIIYPLVIHNDAEPKQFYLSYEGMDIARVSVTYLPAPAEAVNWVKFPEPEPYLQAYETREVPVEFFVPKNVYAPTRWEFLVKIDWEQPGFFQRAYAVLFQINMRA